MDIIHIVQRYFPAISGSEIYIQRISEILSKRHSIKVLCSNALDFNAFGNPGGKFINEYYSEIKNVPIFRFPIKYRYFINKFPLVEYKLIKNILKKLTKLNIPILDFYNILLNGPYCPGLLQYLLDCQSDIIHSSCFPFSINLFALIASKLNKVPAITTPFYHFANPRYHDQSLLRVLARFDRILTCTKLEARYLIKNIRIKRIKDKIELIKMGVDIKKFKKAEPHKFRAKFEIDTNPLILFCGYKNYEKGAIHLLQSIKYVIKKIPNAIYLFIGPSTKAFNLVKKALDAELKQHIINIGVVPYDNIKIKINSFAAADVYAMPSRSDAYGIAFLEAFACKKPVIGANIGATPEVIRDNIDGLLVPFGNPKILANAIIKLLKNPELRDKFGENGYEKIKNQTWESVSTSIERIYKKLVQK